MEVPPCPDGLKAIGFFEDGIYHIQCVSKTVQDFETEQSVTSIVVGTGLMCLIALGLLCASNLSTRTVRRWRSRSRGVSDETLL